ncbi:MAG: Teichoic acids export ATP-binding protein TagH [candidate division WS6 bacterium OLB20]|uniref:Teichoic acids export ATP-binding protein TagH n=1 Tax=candidate division WS6 bacterium OLB20 TaxID=1617426 RepID=A0A136LVZ8_9BACT|nr:MAG: Teichoic acids export ATP-binding protein TagH [candidate division WS6 bacterium OLB20]
MNTPIIEVNNLTKYFSIPHERRDTLKSVVINPFKRIKKETFRALENVSFTINKGEFVGLIGRNGSGKSTLLQVLAGIYAPSSGTADVNGTVIPFLQLGVGFNDELSGRENVFLNGTILGMTREYLEKRYEDIVDFAEIGDFMDLQLKNYSSGMRIRLALAIAVQAHADIYLLDEVLSVGDDAFRQKSLAKMQEFLRNGATVIYVSHGMDTIRQMCSRVLLLEDGKLTFDGDVDEGLTRYQLSYLNNRQDSSKRFGKAPDERVIDFVNPYRSSYGEVKLTDVSLNGQSDQNTFHLATDQEYTMSFELELVSEELQDPWVGLSATRVQNPELDIYYVVKPHVLEDIKKLKKGERLTLTFKDRMPLNPGEYVFRLRMGSHVGAEERQKHNAMVEAKGLKNYDRSNMIFQQAFIIKVGLSDTEQNAAEKRPRQGMLSNSGTVTVEPEAVVLQAVNVVL